MKRLAKALAAACLAALVLVALAGPAQAFGLKELDVTFTEEDSSPATLAGSHPFAQTTTLAFDTVPTSLFKFEVPDGNVKNLTVSLPPGFVGDPTAVTSCSNSDFVLEACPPSSQVGVIDATVADPTNVLPELPVYSLVAAPGAVAKLGFIPINVPVTVDLKLNPNPPYNVLATLQNTSNAIPIYRSVLSIFGSPPGSSKPFLTLPRACEGQLSTIFEGSSWEEPGTFTEPQAGATPLFLTGCDGLEFGPTIAAQPTTTAADSPSGLDFDLEVDDPGLTDPGARADSDIEKVIVTLPEGLTTNSSIASGLSACSLAQYNSETVDSDPGSGCPGSSKVGELEVTTPLLEETLKGSIYVATQGDNPFDSLLAIYMVFKNPKLGIIVKQAAKVEPDPLTGQLTTTVDQIPQLPFAKLHFHFRDGPRAPLITPATCGPYTVSADLYPYADPAAPVHRSSTFQVSSGAGGAPCATSPSQLPNSPVFSAGTLSPLAGAYSPFVFRLARADGSQQLRSISTTLPKGLLGRVAGIPYCSEAQIATAMARGGENQGALELAQPSCPAASELGTVNVGAGAGPQPYYVSGKAYLAGPYKGAPLSLEIITPALAGPFDLGVVAVRTALHVDPETAQINAVSDPVPAILHGLPLDVRSIALDMSRPDFTLNPTSCEPSAVTGAATSTLGSVAPLNSYFQAASCGALGFKPKLALKLKGGTKRDRNPALSTTLTYPKGAYANIARAQVTLPHSEFLDQSHIKTICTRVQFAADQCPKGSIYGSAKATSPLLAEPLSGPVYLRSSSHELPDLVISLKGQIDVALVGRIDTGKGDGIRSTFDTVPDAPVSKFTLSLNGGKKGLLVNSQNICRRPQRAIVNFTAQNGKRSQSTPLIANGCGKAKGKRKHRGR